jgi:hypothetical protein
MFDKIEKRLEECVTKFLGGLLGAFTEAVQKSHDFI